MRQESANTQAIETRLDIRDIAAIHRFYKSNGYHPISKSALIREAVQDFLKILVLNGHTEKFVLSKEAVDYLNNEGFSLNKRSFNILSKQIDLETIVARGHDDTTVTSEKVREAVELMRK